MRRIIASAYREGATHTENAAATARLIQYMLIEGMQLELALGVYKGKREIAVVGHDHTYGKSVPQMAKAICRLFGQESVYFSEHNKGHLLFADGTVQELGPEHTSALRSELRVSEYGHIDGWTEFLSGVAMFSVPHELALAA